MTYRELERLFCRTDWSDPESVKRYKEAAEEYRKEQEEKKDDH